jgi:hypothetical protein
VWQQKFCLLGAVSSNEMQLERPQTHMLIPMRSISPAHHAPVLVVVRVNSSGLELPVVLPSPHATIWELKEATEAAIGFRADSQRLVVKGPAAE